MKALFLVWPGLGHLNPMLPLARSLASAGHDVVFATAATLRPYVEASGFKMIEVGLSAQVFMKQACAAVLRERRDVGLMSAWHFTITAMTSIATPVIVQDVVGGASQWRPDLIVHDSASFAGPISGALLRISTVHFGVGHPPTLLQPAFQDRVAAVWRQFGLSPAPFCGLYESLYLHPFPPSLTMWRMDEFPSVQPVQPAAPQPFPGSHLEPMVLRDRWPTVYATEGSNSRGHLAITKRAARVLGGQPINLILTVGPKGAVDELSPLASNAFAYDYLPNSQVFRRCDLVISHGGSGTVLGALAHGIPVLTLPVAWDNEVNGRLCEKAGVGLSLPSCCSNQVFAASVRRILGDRSFRDSAQKVSEEISMMPTIEEVRPMIEDLAKRRS